MNAYKITELQNANSTRKGEMVEAKSLTEAKRKASRMQMFQGTALEVADADGLILSTKENGAWNDRAN
jgi:hypothetical protein